jgi:hypothetical protein
VNVSTAASIAICITLIAGCSFPLAEQQRLASPSGKYEVVVAIRETDATVATPTEIYILKAGSRPTGEPVLRADHVDGLVVRWTGPQSVALHADTARVFHSKEAITVAGDAIGVQLEVTELTRPE